MQPEFRQRDLIDLIGKPWECPCSPPDSFDCWALVVEVRKRMGMQTPAYAGAAARGLQARDVIRHPPTGWKRQEAPSEGCVVRVGNLDNHVGVYLQSGDVIHSRHGVGVCVDRLIDPAFTGGRVNFWEYGKHA